jgi:hypothetical protein
MLICRLSALCVIVCLLGAPGWSQSDPADAHANGGSTSAGTGTNSGTGTDTGAENQSIKDELTVNWLYGPYVRKEAALNQLTMQQREKLFLKQTFTTPGIYLRSGFLALLDQASGTPYQWGGGFDGYERRYASYWGRTAIQNTLSSAGNAALRYEPRYDRCRCAGFGPRTKHALLRNILTYNETEIDLRPQYALYGGTLGAGMLSSLWQPGGKLWTDGYRDVLSQLGIGMVSNWTAEFAPEFKRKFKRQH